MESAPSTDQRDEETAMMLIRARMCNPRSNERYSMSIVLDDGEIHHFYALSDGVHYASTGRFHGQYDAAIRHELSRPDAEILSANDAAMADSNLG